MLLLLLVVLCVFVPATSLFQFVTTRLLSP